LNGGGSLNFREDNSEGPVQRELNVFASWLARDGGEKKDEIGEVNEGLITGFGQSAAQKS